MARILALICSVLAVCQCSIAQVERTEHILGLDEGTESPPATLDDVAFLAGSWSGRAFGGTFEEVWTPPSNGSMMGMFKLVNEGVPSIYEIQLITEENGTLVWKVKHFSREFSAWEEKADYVQFPLVKIAPGVAYFDGLTLKRDGENLIVYLSVGHGDTVSEERLDYKPASLSVRADE